MQWSCCMRIQVSFMPYEILFHGQVQAWEFSGKSRNSCILVKIHAFSFLFMMFWAFLTRFPAFLLKVILMPASVTKHPVRYICYVPYWNMCHLETYFRLVMYKPCLINRQQYVFLTHCIWNSPLLITEKQTNKQTNAVAWPYVWSTCTGFYASRPCV